MRNYVIYKEVGGSNNFYESYIVVLYNECDLLNVEKELTSNDYIIKEVVNGKIIFCKKENKNYMDDIIKGR